jgi:chemotaxis protein CheX
MSNLAVVIPHEELGRFLAQSVLEMFSTMFASGVTLGIGDRIDDLPPCHGLSAIVGLGGSVRGSVVFQCSSGAAGRFTELMTGEAPGPGDQLVKDGVGEIGNILAGGLKKQLDSTGVNVSISIPTVVEGKPHQVSATGNTPWTVLRFTSEGEPILAAARIVHA